MTRAVDIEGRGVRVNGRAVGVGSAIPDSGDLQAHYDWRQASGTSSVTDQTGNGHDLTGHSGPTATINGNQAGLFDGNDDLLTTSWPSESQPNTYFAVFRVENDSGSFQYIFDADTDLNHGFGLTNGTEWRIFAGSSVDGGTHDTNVHIVSALFDGANSVLRIDGTQVASGDTGTGVFGGLSVGARPSGSSYTNVSVGEWFGYPMDKSSIFANAEQYLADEWGVTL